MINEMNIPSNEKSQSIEIYRNSNLKCLLWMIHYNIPRICPNSIEMIKNMQKNINEPSANKKY